MGFQFWKLVGWITAILVTFALCVGFFTNPTPSIDTHASHQRLLPPLRKYDSELYGARSTLPHWSMLVERVKCSLNQNYVMGPPEIDTDMLWIKVKRPDCVMEDSSQESQNTGYRRYGFNFEHELTV